VTHPLLPLLRTDGPPAHPMDGHEPPVLPDPVGLRPATGPRAVAWAALAVLLGYPDDGVHGALASVADAVHAVTDRLDPAVGAPLGRLVAALRVTEPLAAQEHYVATIDTRRRCSLHLTYYLHGDTRRRGAALWRIKASLAACGAEPAGGELPDHLPVVLELAAVGDEDVAVRVLVEHRKGLVLLREALLARRSPYADGVAAVLALLPALTPAQARAEAEAAADLAAAGPPTETVGLPSWTAPFRSTPAGQRGDHR
jgi:nitrate reductase molybdenum cofactor assembly chaperone NarJ/NarW